LNSNHANNIMATLARLDQTEFSVLHCCSMLDWIGLSSVLRPRQHRVEVNVSSYQQQGGAV